MFSNSGPSPPAIVGCVRMASRSIGYGRPANIAVCTTAMTSPASTPIIENPRMRSSPPTRAFMNPCVSSVVSIHVSGTGGVNILKISAELGGSGDALQSWLTARRMCSGPMRMQYCRPRLIRAHVEQTAQPLPAAGQARPNRADRHAEDVGRLVVAQPFESDEQDDLALFAAQLRERILELA